MGDIRIQNISAEKKSTSFFLEMSENPDGTLHRPFMPLSPPTAENADSAVHSKDVPLNAANSTWLRIYRPNLPTAAEKLPIILYFHGGGFVMLSAATTFYHTFCEEMTKALPALVISVDYRLAPEHRLPAAYDDAMEALLWLRTQEAAGDPWLSNGDFSRCFLMGSSSGGNIVYQLGVQAATLKLELAGIILSQPYFGGIERTPAELASDEDDILPLRANDMMWDLSLPEGADRSHEFCNPKPPPPGLAKCLVKGCIGDPLIDRNRAFAELLEKAGVNVVSSLNEKGFHAIELFVPDAAQALFDEMRNFM